MTPTSLVHTLTKFAAVAFVAAAFGAAANAQNVTASDDASATNYPGGSWGNGTNGGSGFGAWNLPGSAGTDGFNGSFIGTATGFSNYSALYTSGVAFSIYAGNVNLGAGAFQDAIRPFAAAMSTGQVLSFSVGFSFDNGNKGFDLYSNTDGTGQVFNFNIGTSYSWTGGTANMTTWTGARENGVVINFSFTKTASGFGYSINSSQDSGLTQSGNITAAGLGSMKFYISGAGDGDGGNLYFNNFRILGDPAPPATPTITSASSANGTAGTAFSYQTTVTPSLATTYNATGLPIGLSMNSTTGLISGIPSASGNSSVTIVATNSVGSSGNFTLTLAIAPPVAPTVTSALGGVTVPGPFSYQIEVTPSGVPTTYSGVALPAGLSLNSTTGLITGNFSSTGIYSITINATNEGGSTIATGTVYVGSSSDTADSYLPNNWTEGSNQSAGTGLGNWTFSSNGTAGGFLGDPYSAGITKMTDPSFGLFANPEGSGAFVDARRNLTSPLAVGDTLGFVWGTNWFSSNGSKGFVIFVGEQEAIVVNNSGSDDITVNSINSGMGYGTLGMIWSFTQTSNTSITVTATQRNGSSPDYANTITTNGTITGMKFYASGLPSGDNSDNYQPYFNYFVILPGSSPEPNAYDSWANDYNLNPAVTTGPTAGASTADPDSDSFTNQQEYAFGTDPVQATAGLMTTSNTGGNLTVTFLTRTELSYMVQTTDNLATTPFADNPGIAIDNGPPEPTPPSGYIRKQFTITPSGGKNFYRVIATEQTPG